MTRPISAMEVAPKFGDEGFHRGGEFGVAHRFGEIDPDGFGLRFFFAIQVVPALLFVDGHGVFALLELLRQDLGDGRIVEAVGASRFGQGEHDFALDVAEGGEPHFLSLAFMASFMSALMRSCKVMADQSTLSWRKGLSVFKPPVSSSMLSRVAWDSSLAGVSASVMLRRL